MAYEIRELQEEDFPKLLFQIEDPPEKLFMAGKMPGPESKFLCVVGSRKYSGYGKEVCQKVISNLRGTDIVIVSGLALGIDSIAHESALEAGLHTIAIPGSGLHPDVLYPKTNAKLADRIVESGGALLSEFEERFGATPWSFPQRNRLMAGMSDAVLIIEAEERSGTLITARLAMEYNHDVLVVPGDIFSRNSVGSNNLLKDGATPIFKSEDILEALDITPDSQIVKHRVFDNLGEDEKKIVELLKEPLTKDELLEKLEMDISRANILLSSMEIKGMIKESYGKLIVNL
jgi:DNA processing protein